MTEASLFNWDTDRRLLQGGVDVFGDNFGSGQTTTHTTEAGNPPNMTFHQDFRSYYTYPNGLNTILRINNCSPEYITHEYVDTLFDAAFGKPDLKGTKKSGKQTQKCIVM